MVGALRQTLLTAGVCIHRAERVLLAHRLWFLFRARFVSLLNPAAAALAGARGVRFTRYLPCAIESAVVSVGLGWVAACVDFSRALHIAGGLAVYAAVLAATRHRATKVLRQARTGTGAAKGRALMLALVIGGGLPGCTVGPTYTRPAVPVPAEWRSPAEAAGSLADLGWWQLFQDPVLQDLIRTALDENKDLLIAVARVAEARAQLGITRAAEFPQVDGQASYTAQRFSEQSFPLNVLPRNRGVSPEQDFYRTGLDLSFELDLWGRLRRATEAAQAELLASEANRHTVVMTLVSDVAQAYFDLLELDREVDIDRRTVASRRASLELVRERFEAGLGPELDVRRAEQELATAAATVPNAERQIAQAENRLSILVGHNPGPIARGAALEAETLPPAVPAGLPSALLRRRPDILQAEERLVAANARIGEAKAAFFPQISLTGTFGVESAALSDLFTGPSRVWQVGPAMTVPIFTAGRLRSKLRATEAREQQALIQYQQTIQQAFREAEDALMFHRTVGEIRAQRELRVTAARQALTLANLRYTNGLANYLDVLDAERQLFSAETDLASTARDRLTAVVQVYKALGGGWEVQPPLRKVEQQ